MGKTISNIEVIIEGIIINESFSMDKYVHQEYISNVNCTIYGERKVKISGKIESEDKNKNYLIFLDFKEFLLRLFVLFGVNVKIDEIKTKIDTDVDFKRLTHVLSSPNLPVDGKDILEYEELVKDSLYTNNRNGEFYNLIESNQEVDMLHRFRALFATFDKIAPKQSSSDDSINYNEVKGMYVDIIKHLYTNHMFIRYHEFVKELISLNLIDKRANKNYSEKLEDSFKALNKGIIIDEEVSFNLLKCIQVLRNKVNHGDLNGITPKAILGSYELILPLTKELMRNTLKNDININPKTKKAGDICQIKK